MSWNPTMLLSLVLLLFAVTVNSKYRGPPDAVKNLYVDSVRGVQDNYAFIWWYAFEVDTESYKIELVSSHDGESVTKTFEEPSKSNMPRFFKRIGLEPNATYILRVFAVNEHGQSLPSSDIILPQDDSGCSDWPSECYSRPRSPREPIVKYILGNRVNVTWNWRDRMNKSPSGTQSPIEFIIRYGDSKNSSLWNTLKTNKTWIILDDLKKDTQYSAYVLSKKGNSTSSDVYLFPIFMGEDMTGLPEPVITIESVFKKEVFTPGDPMTIKCSIPPNSNMYIIDMELTVGERAESLKNNDDYWPVESVPNHFIPKAVTSITMYTTANEDVDTAKCRVSVRDMNQVSRSSQRSWKVDKTLSDEYLRRRYQEIEADEEFMSFRKA